DEHPDKRASDYPTGMLTTSAFPSLFRAAVCGVPLGSTDMTAPGALMKNLLGDDVHDWHSILADPRAHLHLYGKSEVKPGRKMGHVNRVVRG
ncbi:MAG: hypothetical protein EAZ40_06490, partial [Rhodobacterales bacterium]